MPTRSPTSVPSTADPDSHGGPHYSVGAGRSFLSMKQKIVLISLLALLAIGGGAWLLLGKTSPAQKLWEQGKQLEAVPLPDDAKAKYIEAIKLDANFAPVYRSLAELTAKQHDSLAAMQAWEEYLKHEPNAVHARCVLAQQCLLSRLEVPALRYAEEELKRDPNCSSAHLTVGLLTVRKGNAAEALKHLEIAAKAYPEKPAVQLTYGRVLALAEQLDPAETVLRGVLNKDKAHSDPYYWLGYVLARRGKPEQQKEAEELLKKALLLEPSHAPANFELAKLLQRQRRSADALPFAQAAVARRRHFPAALFTLAEIYRSLGKSAEATKTQQAFQTESGRAQRLKELLRSYAADNKNPTLERDLGLLQLELEDPETGIMFLKSALEKLPTDSAILDGIARAEALLKARR